MEIVAQSLPPGVEEDAELRGESLGRRADLAGDDVMIADAGARGDDANQYIFLTRDGL